MENFTDRPIKGREECLIEEVFGEGHICDENWWQAVEYADRTYGGSTPLDFCARECADKPSPGCMHFTVAHGDNYCLMHSGTSCTVRPEGQWDYENDGIYKVTCMEAVNLWKEIEHWSPEEWACPTCTKTGTLHACDNEHNSRYVWTDWYNKDGGGAEDDERFQEKYYTSRFTDKMCKSPIAVRARVVGSDSTVVASEGITVDVSFNGLHCVAGDKQCPDFEVKMCCRSNEIITQLPEWTEWGEWGGCSGIKAVFW